MYADTDDFRQADISGIIENSTKLCRHDGRSMTWNRKLPCTFQGVQITTQYVLIDTKRSQTNYINSKQGTEFHYCLDNMPNEINTYLCTEIAKEALQKSPVRIAEYLSTGSTIILDCGDYHAIECVRKNSINVIVLRRLKQQSHIPSGRSFKNIAESNASVLLHKLFPRESFLVFYEPMTLNFSNDVVILENSCIHCYNVDFSLRMKISSNVFGIEVKTDKASYMWKKNETHAKARKYEEYMGSPCFLLIMNPEPIFYSIDDTSITSFNSWVAFQNYISKTAQ